MASKKKRRRIRVKLKMYVVLFSLLAAMVTMMVIHKPIVTAPIVSLSSAPKDVEKKVIVVLDPGHGGYDSGSKYDTIYEKDIALTIAKLTGGILTKHNIQVEYTRDEDLALSENEISDLQARIDFGIEKGASYFVSLHMNESPSLERSNGFEVFVNRSNEKGSYLANQVSDTLDELHYTQRRSILDGSGLHVLSFNPVPAILIEMGFMSDDEDRAYLTNVQGQQRVANAIADAIIASVDHDY